MAELKPYRGEYYLWQYVPKRAAAIIFLLFFLAMTALVAYRMYKSKTWFCTPFVVGGFFQVIGYGARAGAHDKTDKMMPYVIQNAFILLAPALYAATIYMLLGRTIQSINGESHSIIPRRWLTKIFVTADVLSFVVQGGAAGLMVTGDNASIGEKIVIAGLFIQIVAFSLFIVTTAIFHMRIRNLPTLETREPNSMWESTICMLYSVSALILIRSIFRVVEFAMGQGGYLLRHEWPLYAFDSALMFLVMVIFFWYYPEYKSYEKGKVQATILGSF